MKSRPLDHLQDDLNCQISQQFNLKTVDISDIYPIFCIKKPHTRTCVTAETSPILQFFFLIFPSNDYRLPISYHPFTDILYIGYFKPCLYCNGNLLFYPFSKNFIFTPILQSRFFNQISELLMFVQSKPF